MSLRSWFASHRSLVSLQRAYFRSTSILFSGNRYYCPCCDRAFRRFRSFGLNRRADAQCPACMSLERHRYLWLFLSDILGLDTEHRKLLHVAPERCIADRLKAVPDIDYLSIDLRPSAAMLRADITDIPAPDGSFDAIICSHVLEHIQDDQKAMEELFRVLKPRGWAVIQAPVDTGRASTLEDSEATSSTQREQMFGLDDHVRTYGLDLKQRLSCVGFHVDVKYCSELYDAETIGRNRMEPTDSVYFCSKGG